MKVLLIPPQLGSVPFKPSENFQWLVGKSAALVLKILLGVFLSHIWSGGNVAAQVRFVQITDPHLFDKAERKKNEEIFIDAIWEINKLQTKDGPYDFVVVTGDIGVESIVRNEGEKAIGKNAKMMADKILALSEVKQWLFVPGNNDLQDELPHTIRHYHQFIEALRLSSEPRGIKVEDLCPRESRPPYTLKNKYVFIGFNNASFKNNNDFLRLSEKSTTQSAPNDCASLVREMNSCLEKTPNDQKPNNDDSNCSSARTIRCFQSREIERISGLIKSAQKDKQFVFIFYHIPDVDDPYLMSGLPDDWKLHDFLRIREAAKIITGSDHVNSSWFIDQSLRNEWESIIKMENVKGLFAGHLHHNYPDTYERYPNEAHSKLYVCPPIALKLQAGKNPQARGFREYSINEQGNIDPAGRNGSVTNRPPIYWYDESKFLFVTTPLPIASAPLSTGVFMSWEKAAHISTALQLFVLIFSVFFIWRQLRSQGEQLKRQTELARVANTQALVALASPFNLEMSQNPEMAKLWILGPKQWDKLSEVEKEQYDSLLRWWFIFYENVFFQGRNGLLDEAIFQCWKADLDSFIQDHRVEKHWSNLNTKYHGEFAKYLNTGIDKKKSSKD